ncbi:hypothetical protein EMGR_005378 [Emarellia grisea]
MAFWGGFRQGALSFAFDQVRSFAGATVSTLGVDGFVIRTTLLAASCGDGRSADVGMIGRGFASDRGFLAGAVHAPRKIVAEAGGSSDRSGFQAPPGAASTVRRHRHTYRFPIGVLHGCGDRGSGICSSSGGDTLPTSNTVVMIDRPKGYGVGMVTRSGLR